MLVYPRWKYLLILVVVMFALVLALPNIFGQDPALQIARKDHDPLTVAALPAIEQFLNGERLAHSSAYLDDGHVMVRFAESADQFKARDAVNSKLADQYITALSIASREPATLRALGLRPMKLGLDLQGGLDLLYQVDTQSAIAQLLDSYAQDLRRSLSQANLPFMEVAIVPSAGGAVDSLRVTLPAGTNLDAVRAIARKALPELPFTNMTLSSGPALQGTLTPTQI